jgi:enoyl-CoA hydratase
MQYREFTYERKGYIGVLRILSSSNRSRDGDALSSELEHVGKAVNDDTEVRVLLLHFDSYGPSGAQTEEPAQRVFYDCLQDVSQPVVCAISGDTAYSALALALASDIRIAAQNARFSLFDGGGAQRLARLVGRGEALRLLLLDESIDAGEALRIGLVSAVHPPEDLEREAIALAERMAARGPIALRYAKEAVRRGLDLPLDEALRMETDLTVILQTTEDRAEGVRAFIEKREPHFQGR